MIPMALLIVGLLALALVLLTIASGPGRAAADPDKETPPTGWPHAHRRPADSLAGGALVCASCGFDVSDTETVIIRDGKVHHVACSRVHRRRTIRPDGVGPC
jgi:hypothetical protein